MRQTERTVNLQLFASLLNLNLNNFQLQLRRVSDNSALRKPREEHQEQTEDQRRPEGRASKGVPGGNRETQSPAVQQVKIEIALLKFLYSSIIKLVENR